MKRAIFIAPFDELSEPARVAELAERAERRDLGVATASANLFRSLGGAIGTATFGAVYSGASIFLYAAPVAVAAFLVVTLLHEVPLQQAVAAR